MRRFSLLLTAAVLLAAPSALAQDQNPAPEDVVVTGSRIVRQDFEAISPVTTVGSEDLYMSDAYEPRFSRPEGSASRAVRWPARGASSVRVIKACEISLSLGDEPCA